MPRWHTPFTQQFPTRLPLVLAPMAGVSGGTLAFESCRAGALGFIAAGHVTDPSHVQQLEEQIQIFRAAQTRTNQTQGDDEEAVAAAAAAAPPPPPPPLCIGFIGFSTLRDNSTGFRSFEQVLKRHKPAVVQFFAPAISIDAETGRSNVAVAQEHQAKVLLQVGSVAEGIQAIESGADGIVAQGSEGGGHGLRREMGNGTLALAARLVKLAAEAPHKPVVLAAGGIADGRGLAAALALGCDGAVLGTRLWASKEAMGNEALKSQLVVAKSGDDVQRTRVFDQIINSYSPTPWPAPYDSVGALRNKTSEEWDGRVSELEQEISKDGSTLVSQYKSATQEGDTTIAQVLAGEGVGEISAIEAAYDIIVRIDEEAQEAIQNMSGLLVDSSISSSNSTKRKRTDD